MVTRLNSSHVFLSNDSTRVTFFYRMTRLESESFYKISKHVIDKPSLFAQKEMRFFASGMINTG